jgi:uncharacterized protein (TIGR03067 family)
MVGFRTGLAVGLIVLVVFPTADAAPVPKDKKRNYKEMIQGRWRVVGREYNSGTRSGPEECFWTYTDDKMVITNSANEKTGSQFSYTIDASQSPMHLDLFMGTSHYQGLFEIDGNTMKWANTGPNGKRPATVTSANNVNLILFARE